VFEPEVEVAVPARIAEPSLIFEIVIASTLVLL
jgi:hypothetical protein